MKYLEQVNEPHIPEFIHIKSGRFNIGSDIDIHNISSDSPARIEYLPPYCISKFPITNTQYAKFIEETKYNPPDHWIGVKPPIELLDHPVTHVNFNDALEYCSWLHDYTGMIIRLPTEEEWEKAARGNTPSNYKFPWGMNWTGKECNHKGFWESTPTTTPVTQFINDNISDWGVIDMIGNVWEWTNSWYIPYPNTQYFSESYGEIFKVCRGGAFTRQFHEDNFRISFRGRVAPSTKNNGIGFRVIYELPIPFEAVVFAVLNEDQNEISGSGFLIKHSKEWFGITCNHVVYGFEKKITIFSKFFDKLSANIIYRNNQIIKESKLNYRIPKLDIAILKIDANLPDLEYINFSRKTNLELSNCYCFGYPEENKVYGKMHRGIKCTGNPLEYLTANYTVDNNELTSGTSGAPIFYGKEDNAEIIGMVHAVKDNSAYIIPYTFIKEILYHAYKNVDKEALP